MRAACRNCRFHHAKCNFKPPKAPGRRAPLSSRIPVTLVMRTAAPSNRTSLQRSHPRRPMRFFSAADRPQPTLLGYRRKGGVQRSEAFGLFIDDAFHGTAQGSGLNSKMAPRGNSHHAESWPQRHLVEDSAGRILCVQRNIQSSSGARLTQLPLCNSPLLPLAAYSHRRQIQDRAHQRTIRRTAQ